MIQLVRSFGWLADVKTVHRTRTREEMGQSKVKRRSHTSARVFDREASLTEFGFTAGGSGIVSTEAIASKRPTIQIVYGLDFITAVPEN